MPQPPGIALPQPTWGVPILCCCPDPAVVLGQAHDPGGSLKEHRGVKRGENEQKRVEEIPGEESADDGMKQEIEIWTLQLQSGCCRYSPDPTAAVRNQLEKRRWEKSIGASKGQHFSAWCLHVLLLAGSTGCANTRFPLCKLSRQIEQRLHLPLLLPTPHRRWVAQQGALPGRLLHLPAPVVSHQFIILMRWSFVLASHGGTAMAAPSWCPVCPGGRAMSTQSWWPSKGTCEVSACCRV